MSNDNDFVATKAEKTFNDEGETIKVAELPKANKTSLNIIKQIGNDDVSSKAKDKFSVEKLLGSKQKPAKIITLDPNKKKE